ncbi:MAG TPA: class C beta-lactamase-related serine hydrolase [Flavobacteriaceae bacterium]|nr:class C beta-lactamase-related serine hydrolase [Flavobacteriaceae bacterium]
MIQKILKWITIIIAGLIALVYALDVDYLLKGIRVIYLTGNNTAYLSDYKYFDNRIIEPSPVAEPWAKHNKYNTIEETEKLAAINKERETKAFLVIKNDSVLFEKYFDGYSESSKSNSFSMAKSITVTLLGKAIMDGKIKSLDQPVGDFFDEYKTGLGAELTVGNLASMSSGMKWNEKYYSIINITSESYFSDDLRSVILNQKIIEKPGQKFRYSSGDTQLLGMIIEKATDTNLSDYLKNNFTNPMGFENEALWQLDSEESGMEKAYCCFASNAKDFARFGKLYKNNGKWNNEILLDSAFINKATNPVFDASPYYGYGWWLYDYNGKKVYTMNGHRGQFVIVFPEEDIIIVRLGDINIQGEGDSGDLYKYISEGYNLATSID